MGMSLIPVHDLINDVTLKDGCIVGSIPASGFSWGYNMRIDVLPYNADARKVVGFFSEFSG